MSKHTPGPWFIEPDSGLAASYHMRNAVITSEQHEANAQLIAAAPLMLETLNWLDAIGGLGISAHERITDAIRRATK